MPSPTAGSYPELLSLAVHELRTPVGIVGGYLRMLLRDTEGMSARQQKMVEEASKSCARLVAIIDEMSVVGKLDGGDISLARQPIDLARLLSEVAEHVHEARDRDVQLVLRDDGSAAATTGDSNRLKSAFDAVFRAILREKAGPATVVAERRREQIDGRSWAVVVIADTANVQEAYERPRGVFDEKRGGLGLALPLARRVFEGHGGRLWSPAGGSESDDQATAFSRSSAIVTLPLTE